MADLSDRVREHICGLSDEQLVTYIIVGIDVYEPQAVEFAREEFQRRALDPALVSKLTNEAVGRLQAEREAQAEAAGRPLDFLSIVFAFCAGFTVIGLFSLALRDARFRMAGEDRKSAQLWKSAGVGLMTLIVTVVAMGCLMWVKSD
jgi:hypothetical protein